MRCQNDTDYTHNDIALPQSDVTSDQLDQYINSAISTKLDVSLFAQWKSLEDIMLYNFRLHWIPKIGTDLYVVFNTYYDNLKKLDLIRPESSVGVAKLFGGLLFKFKFKKIRDYNSY